jgi:hypothetical protein
MPKRDKQAEGAMPDVTTHKKHSSVSATNQKWPQDAFSGVRHAFFDHNTLTQCSLLPTYTYYIHYIYLVSTCTSG